MALEMVFVENVNCPGQVARVDAKKYNGPCGDVESTSEVRARHDATRDDARDA
ncbi:MAG: hypothetical protein ACK4TP_04855 [Hyphomicrobium sp.]